MASWVASNWTPADVPGLRQTIRLYDMCLDFHEDPIVWPADEKGKPTRKPNPASELRQMMDIYGITPKGQQDRRWLPPKDDAVPAQKPQSSYRNLRVVGE